MTARLGDDAAVPDSTPPRPPATRATWLALLAVLTLLGAGVTALAVFPPTRVAGSIPWDGAEILPDDQTLIVKFVGFNPSLTPRDACWEGYRTTVNDVGDHVEVAVDRIKQSIPMHRTSDLDDCRQFGYPRAIEVDLPRPLAGRRVHDLHQGRGSRPVFAMGHAFVMDVSAASPSLKNEVVEGTPGAPTLKREYLMDARATFDYRPDADLTIQQGPDARDPLDARAEGEVVQVGSRELHARWDTDRVSLQWEESGQNVVMVAERHGPGSPRLSFEAIVKIADTIHIPA